jgi:hypothetical protein
MFDAAFNSSCHLFFVRCRSLVSLTQHRGEISCGFHSLITRQLLDLELQIRGKIHG